MRVIPFLGVLALFGASLAQAAPVNPPFAICLVTSCDKDLPAFGWQGESHNVSVTFPSRATGAALHARLFWPASPSAEEYPAVVILPGSSGVVRETNYRWSAKDLAGHGYVALSVDPQGIGQSQTFGEAGCSVAVPPCPGAPYQQISVWVDGGVSGIDFLMSEANPIHDLVDHGKIGAAGHSLGARAASVMQDIDPRVKAIVAWDNLASSSEGDEGSASGGPPFASLMGAEVPNEGRPIVPRRPAMGHASDAAGVHTGPTTPETKKTAFLVWREAGVPSMELAFHASAHGNWAQSNVGAQTGNESALYRFEHYTRAWFDLWLRDDGSALERLMSTNVDGVARSGFLSQKWNSGAYLPGAQIDCPDLRVC